MYTEIVTLENGCKRLRENIDPECKWFTDDNLKNIIATCSGMLDRAVVKCLLGIQQKAKDNKDVESLLWSRTILNRFEAGLIQI